MRKHFFLLIISVVSLLNTAVNAQELKAKVTVMAGRVATTVDRKIFTTLQTQLNNFMNNRKWTADVFRENEKIECSFIVNIEENSNIIKYKDIKNLEINQLNLIINDKNKIAFKEKEELDKYYKKISEKINK